MSTPLTRETAFALLNLVPGPVGPSVIKRAAAMRIMSLHPDTSAGHASGVTIAQVQAARDLLVSEQHGKPCALCKGRGKVLVGMAARDCVACDGTGERL